jgi:putative transposase
MRGPKPPSIELEALERQELQRLVKRHLTPQQLVLRARIVLAAADGANNRQIARQLGVSLDTVRRWRARWIALGAASLEDLAVEERLTDAPRPGKPRTITPEQECQIIALACESPHHLRRRIRRSDPSASGPAGRSPRKSSAGASARRFRLATQGGCSKGGSQTASDPLLADAV